MSLLESKSISIKALCKKHHVSALFAFGSVLRPDFSTGHLSRNYNEAIINSFEDLNDPKCDVVITCQVDTILLENWYQEVLKYLEKYNYICVGHGDQSS